MSKFRKRIQKVTKKDIRHCVMVGNNPDCIENVISSFDTVFCVNWKEEFPKFKNVIPIEETRFLQDQLDINVIFINQRFDENILQFIVPLTKRVSPVIFVKDDIGHIPEFIGFFQRIKYEMITLLDQYQIWKQIRK